MLDGLDDIDWVNIPHIHSSPEKIPETIRDLLSGDDHKIINAFDFLFGRGQDSGVLSNSLPYIAPFLIELLAYPILGLEEDILWNFGSISGSFIVPWQSHYSIKEQRLILKCYEALEVGLELYISLLDHPDSDVRSAASNLLWYFTEHAERISLEYRQHFETESVEAVKIELIKNLGNLFNKAGSHFDREAPERLFIQAVVESSSSQKLRAAASLSMIECYMIFDSYRDDNVWGVVGQILNREYFVQTNPYEKTQIVKAISLISSHPLLDLLKNPDIDVEDAHLIARGILHNRCSWGFYNREHMWDYSPDYEAETERHEKIYTIGGIRTDWLHLDELKAIISSEKFWQMPTNMFSAFYGLPDSREELQALMNSQRHQE